MTSYTPAEETNQMFTGNFVDWKLRQFCICFIFFSLRGKNVGTNIFTVYKSSETNFKKLQKTSTEINEYSPATLLGTLAPYLIG